MDGRTDRVFPYEKFAQHRVRSLGACHGQVLGPRNGQRPVVREGSPRQLLRYVHRALIANAMVTAVPSDPVTSQVLGALDAKKIATGEQVHWEAGDTLGNFSGRGGDLVTTTTAMVTHALLRTGGYIDSVNGALNYLVPQKDTLGGYGSTHTKIWTLGTLLLEQAKGTESAVGQLTVPLDGPPVRYPRLDQGTARWMSCRQ